VSHRPDAGDLEELQDTVRSPGYSQIRTHLARLVEAKLRELVKPSDAEATARLRGEIAGLQIALEVPTELQRDMKAALAREKPKP
jgi:hypothetical protein